MVTTMNNDTEQQYYLTAPQSKRSAMLPSNETFAIPELLEMILEHATLQELLLWQRVSKTWQATLQKSPRIQEKLHFRIRPCKNKHEQETAMWNPFMKSFSSILDANSCEITNNDAFGANACYPTASWKQMFITSPALIELKVSLVDSSYLLHTRPGRRHLRQVKSIACKTGITIGQVADAQKRAIAYHASRYNIDSVLLRRQLK